MQTFLPYNCFFRSAKSLDMKRLGKQRVEVLQILNCLLDPHSKRGWKNHPAVKMWKHHEGALANYGGVICQEWITRGYKDTCLDKIYNVFYNNTTFEERAHKFLKPAWYGDTRIHVSHQSNLLRKDPTYYGSQFNDVPSDLPYFWPV